MKKWADFAVVEGINSSESNLWGCILIWEKVLSQNPSPQWVIFPESFPQWVMTH